MLSCSVICTYTYIYIHIHTYTVFHVYLSGRGFEGPEPNPRTTAEEVAALKASAEKEQQRPG